MRSPKIALAGDNHFLSRLPLPNEGAWRRTSVRKADFVFAYVSEPISAHCMAKIWTAFAHGIHVYLFFQPGVDRELFWHCRRAAVQWMGFTTVNQSHLSALFEEILANWQCRR